MPEDASVQYDYAWAAYSLGKLREAQDSMQRLLSLSPTGAAADDAKRFLAMLALLENSDGANAEKPEVQNILREDPNYVPALIVEAYRQRQQGQLKSAEELCARILERFPDFALAQRELAAVLAADASTSVKAYELAMKARKTLPEDPELGRVLGALYYQRKEYAQAIQILQQSARKKPLNPDSLFFLGMAHLAAKQRPQGLEALNRAIAEGLKSPRLEEAAKAVAEPPPKASSESPPKSAPEPSPAASAG